MSRTSSCLTIIITTTTFYSYTLSTDYNDFSERSYCIILWKHKWLMILTWSSFLFWNILIEIFPLIISFLLIIIIIETWFKTNSLSNKNEHTINFLKFTIFSKLRIQTTFTSTLSNISYACMYLHTACILIRF